MVSGVTQTRERVTLISDVEISIEPTATVIVGRTKSGKTSLTEIFEKFLSKPGGQFRSEDFSSAVRPSFITGKALRDADAPPEEILAALPKIALELTFSYPADAGDLGPLSPFIIDPDANCTTAVACAEAQLR